MHRYVLILILISLIISFTACGTPQSPPQVGVQPTVTQTIAAAETPTPRHDPSADLMATLLAAPSTVTPTSGAGDFTKKVDVGGRGLNIICVGTGSPTVVLDAGAADTSGVWAAVQSRVKETTQVCAYDRANVGQSDPAPKPRTTQDMVKDLHTLLVNAHLVGPYVLVGHSAAGWNVRLYASQYPKEVVGIVLVDAAYPDQLTRMVAVLPPASPSESADLTQFRKESATGPSVDAPDNPEGQDFAASAAQAHAASSLGDIPLVVLTAGIHDQPPFITADVAAKMEQAWQAMQKEQVGLSSNSIQIMAKDSYHCIHCGQPQIVSDAIQQVIEAVRNHTRLKAP